MNKNLITLALTLTLSTYGSPSNGGEADVVVQSGTITPDIGGFSAEEGGNYTDGYTDNVPDVNCTETFATVSALTSAASYKMAAGTTLCLADGTYHGLELDFGGQGSANAKITIAAEHPGKAIIDGGATQIDMSGQHVVLQGFVLKNGDLNYNVLATRGNGNLVCNQCRVTEMTITDMDGGSNSSSETRKWFEIYGSYNRFDHNWISGKTSRGALLIVDRTVPEDETFDPDNFEKDYAQIDYNYFGDRPPINGAAYAASSDNEYEGVRIGVSTSHEGNSFSKVEDNYFERIQGEPEVISNKSGGNIIRNNTIRNSRGGIVSRHGENAVISNNFIFGDDYPFSAGIRLVDGGHTVTNNYIEGPRYLNTSWNGGIVISSGNGSTTNGYQNVENVLIANNTIVDSVNSLNVFGGKYSTEPEYVYFINNIITEAIGPVIRSIDNISASSVYAGNIVYGQRFSDNSDKTSLAGFSFDDPMLEKSANDGLYRPSDNSPDLTGSASADTGEFNLPTIDMDGQTRTAATMAGADEVLPSKATTLKPLTPSDVGPKTYVATPGHTYIKEVAVANHDFDSGDLTGWTGNGGVITTATDEVFSRGNSLKFNTNDADASQTVTVTANTDYTLSAFMKGTAELSVTIDGETYKAERNSTTYDFSSVTFNSGAATSAIIKARVDDEITNQYIADSDFVGFKAGSDEWTTSESDNDGTGDVGTSSNSASGADGSVKLGYTYFSHAQGTPNISQQISLDANEAYEFAIDLLIKSSADGAAIIVNIEGNESVIMDNQEISMADTTDADLDDHFERYTQAIDSGNNTSATVTVSFKAQDIISGVADSVDATKLSSDSAKANELRVDNVSITANGTPADGTEAFFDSIRLVAVSHDID